MRVLSRCVAALVATAATGVIGAPAHAQTADTTAPTVAAATLDPATPTGMRSPWYRGPVTVTFSATDDVAVAKFQYSTDAGATFTDLPVTTPGQAASASVSITTEGLAANAVRYRAVDTAGNASAAQQATVRIDTKPPVVTWPTLADGPITPDTVLRPTLTDPQPGSGGTGTNAAAFVEMHINGTRVNPTPVKPYALGLGTHRVRLWVNDPAGNAQYSTLTFTVAAAGDGAYTLSSGGVTTEPASHPTQPAAVTPTAMTPNPNAAYKVLIVGRTQGFRHNHIPDTMVAIQKLGAEHGFDVDIFDPALPGATLATNPMTSAASLAPYKAVIFDSTTGNGNFSTEEMAAFEQYIRAGGGYVGIHAATDCCRAVTGTAGRPAWSWYQSLAGGIFSGHPQGPTGLNPGCETCFWATVQVEDSTHASTQHFPRLFKTTDELYNFDRNPRQTTHVLQTLDEASFEGNLNFTRNPGGTMPNDHPISWCQNYDGGRGFTQALGHLREVWYNPAFLRNILGGIQTAAGVVPANCVSHREVRELVAAAKAAGTLTAAAADRATELINSSFASYAPPQRNFAAAKADADALRVLAQQPESGDATARGQLLAKANELREWMLALGSDVDQGTVGGAVPATLALSLSGAPSFGGFTPALAKDYETTGTATVTSTAGDATLTVSDPSTVAAGHLVNGAYALAQPLQAKASSAGGLGAAYGAVSGTPRTLLSYAGPISSDAVTLGFKQSIASTDPLRTGSYSKTLTYTLSTTQP